MGIKNAVNKKVTKDYEFCGETIKIAKLSVRDVFDIEKMSKDLAGSPKEIKTPTVSNPMQVVEGLDSESVAGLNLLKKIICIAVVDASELTDEDWMGFPFDELQNLSQEIMDYSGMGANAGKT